MNKLLNFLKRFMNGEDVILVQQSKEQWEQQFTKGIWDRLQVEQANTAEIAGIIFEYTKKSDRKIKVLDVGCGNGGLARFIYKDVSYTGIDVSKSAISAAKTVAPSGEFIECDALFPPNDLGVFDIIVFNELLYYVDPNTVLSVYKNHAVLDTIIVISIVRFWRSWFLWRRIIRKIKVQKHSIISNANHRWDVVTGFFI